MSDFWLRPFTIFLLLWATVHALFVHGQYQLPENNIWLFGRKAGYDFNTRRALTGEINAAETSNALCDEGGALLFYTDGSRIWDRNHVPMPSANPMFPAPYSNQTSSTVQGAVIVPITNHHDRYYVFSLSAQETVNNGGGKLYYAIVDMSLRNGLGDVLPGYSARLLDTGLSEHMIAIPTCDAVWLLVHQRTTAEFKAYRIAPDGISPAPVISKTGVSSYSAPASQENKFYQVGQLAVSNDYTQVAATYFSGSCLEWYTFDNQTGQLQARGLIDSIADAYSFYGVAFSPDNSRLYASSCAATIANKAIFQYDLQQVSIEAVRNSKSNIAPAAASITQLQLGPDGKLYFNGNYISRMGVIHYPNLLGASCAVDESGIVLDTGTNASAGFHNTIMKAVPVADTIHTVVGHSAYCFEDATRVIATDTSGRGYRWNTGDTSTGINVHTSGKYWVGYYNSFPCTYRIDTFNVVVGVSLPLIQTRNSCNDGQNGRAWVAGKDSTEMLHYSFLWQKEGSADTLSRSDALENAGYGRYNVTIRTRAGCDTVLYFDIFRDNYKVHFTLADSILCVRQTVQVQNGSPAYFTSFLWNFSDGFTDTTFSPVHDYAIAGLFRINLVGTNGYCFDTAHRTVIVDAPANELYFQINEPHLCLGTSLDLAVRSTSSEFVSFYWQLGDGNSLYTSSWEVEHAYDRAGIFPIVLTGKSRACPDKVFTDTVIVQALPRVDIGQDSVICLGEAPIALRNRNTDDEGYLYRWNTGYMGSELVITQPGIYSLRITDVYGCTGEEQVRVIGDCQAPVPNVFTPNGDGINDYFYPRPFGRTGSEVNGIQIFDRWGQLAFKSDRLSGQGWDGRFNDREVPAGVYIYVIDLLAEDGQRERYRGNVTLIR